MEPSQRALSDRFPPLALAQANQSNHLASLDYRSERYIAHFGRGAMQSAARAAELHWCRLGAGGAFNLVYGARLDRRSAETGGASERVAAMTRLVARGWREPAYWLVGSEAAPAGLARLLERRGWQYGYDWKEMGLSLRASSWKQAAAAPVASEGGSGGDGIGGGEAAVSVATEAERAAWLDVQRRGYALDPALTLFMDELATALLAAGAAAPFTLYTLAPDGTRPAGPSSTPVAAAAAALFRQGDTAGIYMLATAPEHRRRGYATRLLRRIIGDAADAGCGACVLQTPPECVGLYRRLGFLETGRIAVYRSPESA